VSAVTIFTVLPVVYISRNSVQVQYVNRFWCLTVVLLSAGCFMFFGRFRGVRLWGFPVNRCPLYFFLFVPTSYDCASCILSLLVNFADFEEKKNELINVHPH
jgi:hypothetical protein